MKRARLCTLLALLAGFSLHGQGFSIAAVQDYSRGTSFAPGSLAYIECGSTTIPTENPPLSAQVGGRNAYTVFINGCEMEIQVPINAPLGANIPVELAGVTFPNYYFTICANSRAASRRGQSGQRLAFRRNPCVAVRARDAWRDHQHERGRPGADQPGNPDRRHGIRADHHRSQRYGGRQPV